MLIRHLYYTVYMLFVATRNISENNAPLYDKHGRALTQKPLSQTSWDIQFWKNPSSIF